MKPQSEKKINEKNEFKGQEILDPALEHLQKEMDVFIEPQYENLTGNLTAVRASLRMLLVMLIEAVPNTDLKVALTSDMMQGLAIAKSLTDEEALELSKAFLQRNWSYILNIRKLFPDRLARMMTIFISAQLQVPAL
jgi:hypothetical protein